MGCVEGCFRILTVRAEHVNPSVEKDFWPRERMATLLSVGEFSPEALAPEMSLQMEEVETCQQYGLSLTATHPLRDLLDDAVVDEPKELV